MTRPGLAPPWLRSAVLALGVAVALGGLAQATLSDAVVAALRGKIVLSRGPVAEGASDKETVAKLKAAQLTELVGKPTDDGQSWKFHYTAFLKKVGSQSLKLQFVSGEQDRRLATETSLPIVDAQSAVLSGDLTIAESRGLERGKAYQLKIVDDEGEVVAKTSAIFK